MLPERAAETPGSLQARVQKLQLYINFYCVLMHNTLALFNGFPCQKFLYSSEARGKEKKKMRKLSIRVRIPQLEKIKFYIVNTVCIVKSYF